MHSVPLSMEDIQMTTIEFKKICQFMQGIKPIAKTESIDGTQYLSTKSICDIVEPKLIGLSQVEKPLAKAEEIDQVILDPIMQAKIHENYLATRKRLGYK